MDMTPPPTLDSSTSAPATADEVQQAGRIWAMFSQARTDRLREDYKWLVQWAWYNGRTDIFYDAVGTQNDGQIYRVLNHRPRSLRVRPINLIAHAVDLLVAKWMRARPVWEAGPGNDSATARLAARAARALLRYLWDKNKLTARRRDMLLNRGITGNGFVKVFFDGNSGPFKDDIQPCTTCQGTGAMPMHPQSQEIIQQLQMQAAQSGQPPPVIPPQPPCGQCQGTGKVNHGRIPLGDVQVKPISPWEIWPLPGSKCVEEGVFHAFRLPKEVASVRYNIPIDQIGDSSELDKGESEFARAARMNQISEQQDKNLVWIVEMWEPPAPREEQPRVTILVGNRIAYPRPENIGAPAPTASGQQRPSGTEPLQTGKIPEKYGRIPIFHFRLRPSAENFWSTGVVLDMISCNDFVNRSRYGFHRNQETMSAGKWLSEQGSVDNDQFTDEHGEVIEYRGAEPRQATIVALPEHYVRLQQQEEDNIPKLAGLQDIDKGEAPPNIESFISLHFLAEQSETVHAPVLLEDEEQWRAVAECVLKCALENYNPEEERLTRADGSASIVEVQALMAADQSDNLIVRCEIGSALAHSQALRMAQVYDGIDRGILTPAEARQRGLLDFGVELGENADDHRAQESVAYQENNAMANAFKSAPHPQTGMQLAMQAHVLLVSAHDHAVHYEQHRRAALEAQMNGNAQLAQALDAACQQHQYYMQPPVNPAGHGGPSPIAAPVPPDAQTGAQQQHAAGG